MVVFFTSYAYMEETMAQWFEMGFLTKIKDSKLVFVETKDVEETSLSLDKFKKACTSGRGAIFFSVARGKVAEGKSQ